MKKIISLILALAMTLTLFVGVTVSAALDPSIANISLSCPDRTGKSNGFSTAIDPALLAEGAEYQYGFASVNGGQPFAGPYGQWFDINKQGIGTFTKGLISNGAADPKLQINIPLTYYYAMEADDIWFVIRDKNNITDKKYFQVITDPSTPQLMETFTSGNSFSGWGLPMNAYLAEYVDATTSGAITITNADGTEETTAGEPANGRIAPVGVPINYLISTNGVVPSNTDTRWATTMLKFDSATSKITMPEYLMYPQDPNGSQLFFKSLTATSQPAEFTSYFQSTRGAESLGNSTPLQFDSFSAPKIPSYITASGNVANGIFTANNLKPYTYEYILSNSATEPASWVGAKTFQSSTGSEPIDYTGEAYAYIRTKKGTLLTQNSPVARIDIIPTSNAVITAQINAKADLNSYKSSVDYRQAEDDQIAVIKPAGIYAINEATSEAAVAAALAAAKAKIDVLWTNQQWLDYEALVAGDKVAGKAALDSYIDLNFVDINKQLIIDTIAAGKLAIDVPITREGVAAAIANAKNEIDKIPGFNYTPAISAVVKSNTQGATDITVTSPPAGYTYSVSFNGTNGVPGNVWTPFSASLIGTAVPKGGNNRYAFIKARNTHGVSSYISLGRDLTGFVKAPDAPPITDLGNPKQLKLSWTYSSNAYLGDPYTMDLGFAPLGSGNNYNDCAGLFDVGYVTSIDKVGDTITQDGTKTVTWTAYGKYSNGNFTDNPNADIGNDGIYGRIPFYLAWNAKHPALRYAQDGVIPPSAVTYYGNDLSTVKMSADRYSAATQVFGKYEIEPGTGANMYKFTDSTRFMKYMRYVVWVDRDLSTDTTWQSPSSAYNWKSDYDKAMSNKGQLFRDYALKQVITDEANGKINVFYTDGEGKPFKDPDCQFDPEYQATAPFEMQLLGDDSQYYYIAPANLQVATNTSDPTADQGSNRGIYYIAKDSSAFEDTEVEFGGSGTHSTFEIGSQSYSFPPQNIVQRYSMEPLNQPQAAPTGLAPQAETALGRGDGKIFGTTTAMEYKSVIASPETPYTTCGDLETTGLAAGDYYVRFKTKQGYNAGADATVTILPGPEGVTVTGKVAGNLLNVKVEVAGKTAYTNATGDFSIDLVLPGSYNLVLSRPGGVTRTIPINVTTANPFVVTTTDNMLFILGDAANQDGLINVSDVGIVKTNYGKKSSDAGFNTNCDVNQDGLINVSDVGITKTAYGKSISNYVN